MTDVPKIVHSRLWAAAPERGAMERTHPEADVLTAFAEQALSAAEREGVLQHLALCGDCRDVIALALPAMDLTPTPPESEVVGTSSPDKGRANWLAWASLGWSRSRGTHLAWAALAVGIAVAVLIGGPGLSRLANLNSSTTSADRQMTAPAELTARVASGSVGVRTGDTKSEAVVVPPNLSAHESEVQPVWQAESQLGTTGGAKSGHAKSGHAKPAYAGDVSSTAGTLATPGPHGAPALNEEAKINEKVTAPAGSTSNPLTAETSTNNLIAREEAPAIIRAKPASKAEVNAAANAGLAGSSAQALAPLNGRNTLVVNGAAAQGTTLNQSVSWRIAAGVLQRSLDGGQSWQTGARAEHPFLCYSNRGQEMWAGGQAGTLQHSTDGGTTWSVISVAFKGQPLSSDITHIDVMGPVQIVIATANHETWISADSGTTWEKK